MPIIGRDPTTPPDISKESMVCHSGRFFTPAQFAVYVTKVGPARGEPLMVYGTVRTDRDA